MKTRQAIAFLKSKGYTFRYHVLTPDIFTERYFARYPELKRRAVVAQIFDANEGGHVGTYTVKCGRSWKRHVRCLARQLAKRSRI